MLFAIFANAVPTCSFAPGESIVVPSGSCTTAVSGPLTRGPPVPSSL